MNRPPSTARGTPVRGTPSAGEQASGTPPVAPGVLTNGDLTTPMQLGDFMNELGVVMQLPRRPTTRVVPVIPEPTPRTSRRGWRQVALPVAAVALLLVSLAQRMIVPTMSAEVPAVLHGEWQSSHAEYRTRRLSFSGTHLGIALAPDAAPTLHRVRQVRTSVLHDTTVVELLYEDAGALLPFQLQLVAHPRPRLTLRHPADVVWEPVPAAAPGVAPGAGPSAAPGAAPGGAGADSVVLVTATGLTTPHGR